MREREAPRQSSRAVKACVFYCSNPPEAGQFASQFRGEGGDTVTAIGLPCSGKVDVPYLLKAFETGADGVIVLTCSASECRHLEGTLRTQKRVEAVDSLLEETGVGPGRIALMEWKGEGLEKVLGKIKGFLDKVRDLPPTSQPRPLNGQETATA